MIYMTYSSELNLFLKSYQGLSNKGKIERMKQYPTGDLMALLRNIEEEPSWYEEEIIKSVYECLFDKGIMCI